MGQFEEADRYLREAAHRDPKNLMVWYNLSSNGLRAGRADQAEHDLRRLFALDPDHWLGHYLQGEIYLRRGQVDAALRATRQGVAVNPNAYSIANLGRVYAQISRPDSARAMLNRLQETVGPVPNAASIIYAELGETDRALSLLEDADGNLQMKVNAWWWAPLREEPRFQRLLEQRGLDDASVQQTMDWLATDPDPY